MHLRVLAATAISSLPFALGAVAPATAQTPLLNPGNGHYYAKVATAQINWTTARSTAASMSYQGASGHLATITNLAETQWLAANMGIGSGQLWIGGYQDHGSPAFAEPAGGWTWVTGEQWSFTAWSTSEPNNQGGNEDHLGLLGTGLWNDEGSQPTLPGFVVEYDYGVVVYCTSGTTSSGCVPVIAATGHASASGSSSFTLSASNIEGLKQGILFYGIDNTGFTPAPWSATSTSYLCVKQPRQRTGVQNTGGNFATCDGSLTLDWNAYVASHPGALGVPFAVGQHVFAQGWFRDPPSPKTTMLTNALEFVFAP